MPIAPTKDPDTTLHEHAHRVLQSVAVIRADTQHAQSVSIADLEEAIIAVKCLRATISARAATPMAAPPPDVLRDARAVVLRAQHIIHDLTRSLRTPPPPAMDDPQR